MTTFSVRKFLAAAVVAACLPLVPHTASAAPAANLPDFTDLVDKVGPAVVNIRTTTRVSNSGARGGLPPGMDGGDKAEVFRRFFCLLRHSVAAVAAIAGFAAWRRQRRRQRWQPGHAG